MRRSSKKLPRDPNQLAAEVVRMSTEQPEQVQEQVKPTPLKSSVSQYLAKIGRQGGLKGGKARADALSAAERKKIAKKAAMKRWGNRENT